MRRHSISTSRSHELFEKSAFDYSCRFGSHRLSLFVTVAWMGHSFLFAANAKKTLDPFKMRSSSVAHSLRGHQEQQQSIQQEQQQERSLHDGDDTTISLPLSFCGGRIAVAAQLASDDADVGAVDIHLALETTDSHVWLKPHHVQEGMVTYANENVTHGEKTGRLATLDRLEWKTDSLWVAHQTVAIWIEQESSKKNDASGSNATVPTNNTDENPRFLHGDDDECHTDGSWGLGSSNHTFGLSTRSVWDNIVRERPLRAQMWSLYYHRPAPAGRCGSLIVGGVDGTHYQTTLGKQGLVWHNAAVASSMDDNQQDELFASWDLTVSGCMVGDDVNVPECVAARVDLASMDIVGPAAAVTHMWRRNKDLLECANVTSGGDTDDNEVTWAVVDCVVDDAAAPVDRVVLKDCNGPNKKMFAGISLLIDTQTYELSANMLLPHGEGDDSCRLRLQASHHQIFWTLGLPFVEQYYMAFDYAGRKIGVAKSSADNKEINPEDWRYDIKYDGKDPPTPTPAPFQEENDHVPDPAPRPKSTLPPTQPPTAPKPVDNEGEEPPSKGAPVWALLGWGVLVVFVCLWIRKRTSQRQQKRHQYSLATRYQDDDDDDGIGLGELEMS